MNEFKNNEQYKSLEEQKQEAYERVSKAIEKQERIVDKMQEVYDSDSLSAQEKENIFKELGIEMEEAIIEYNENCKEWAELLES